MILRKIINVFTVLRYAIKIWQTEFETYFAALKNIIFSNVLETFIYSWTGERRVVTPKTDRLPLNHFNFIISQNKFSPESAARKKPG